MKIRIPIGTKVCAWRDEYGSVPGRSNPWFITTKEWIAEDPEYVNYHSTVNQTMFDRPYFKCRLNNHPEFPLFTVMEHLVQKIPDG